MFETFLFVTFPLRGIITSGELMEFIGREKELKELRSSLNDSKTKAILVYGRRRMGKTTLIKEAIRTIDAVKIIYRGKIQSISKTIEELSSLVTNAAGLGNIPLTSLEALFTLIGSRKERFIIVLDEYQDTKKLDGENADALIRNAMEDMNDNIKLIFSGSSIRMMEALTKSDNPLYGRFKAQILVDEMDYYDSQKFYDSYSIRDKIITYSIFGGIPWINESINQNLSVEENIKRLLMEEKGLARCYAEDVINVECSSINYATEIFNSIKNGKKHFSEIQSYINHPSIKTQLSRILKNMTEVRLIRKKMPINSNSPKTVFYEICSNVLRFFFAYQDVLNDENAPNIDILYKNYIEHSLNTFVSYRFEDIAKSYFQRLSLSGKRDDIVRIGSYWYDDKAARKNGEFDVALYLSNGTYEIYECKFLKEKATERLIKEEKAKVDHAPLVGVRKFGFISSSGFDSVNDSETILISGEDLFALNQ